MQGMFENCSSLETVQLPAAIGGDQLDNISFMFKECSALKELDVSGFNTVKTRYMGNLFEECSSLKSIVFGNFSIKGSHQCLRMFYGCSSLTSLDLTGFEPNLNLPMPGMFANCTNLKKIIVSDKWPTSYDLDANGYNAWENMFLYSRTNLAAVWNLLTRYMQLN